MVSSTVNVKVIFRNVRILRDLTPEQLARCTRNNYNSAQVVIAHDLYSAAPPTDVQHLIHLIQNYEAKEIFYIHASPFPMALYSGFYNELYDFIRFILSKAQLRTLLYLRCLKYMLTTRKMELLSNRSMMLSVMIS